MKKRLFIKHKGLRKLLYSDKQQTTYLYSMVNNLFIFNAEELLRAK